MLNSTVVTILNQLNHHNETNPINDNNDLTEAISTLFFYGGIIVLTSVSLLILCCICHRWPQRMRQSVTNIWRKPKTWDDVIDDSVDTLTDKGEKENTEVTLPVLPREIVTRISDLVYANKKAGFDNTSMKENRKAFGEAIITAYEERLDNSTTSTQPTEQTELLAIESSGTTTYGTQINNGDIETGGSPTSALR